MGLGYVELLMFASATCREAFGTSRHFCDAPPHPVGPPPPPSLGGAANRCRGRNPACRWLLERGRFKMAVLGLCSSDPTPSTCPGTLGPFPETLPFFEALFPPFLWEGPAALKRRAQAFSSILLEVKGYGFGVC